MSDRYTDITCEVCGYAMRPDGSCDGRIRIGALWECCPHNPRPNICDLKPECGDKETGSIGLVAAALPTSGGTRGQGLFSPLALAIDPSQPADGAFIVCMDCIDDGREAPDEA